MKTAILILGMHRSGTSALTGIMNILGLNVGKNLFQGKAYSEKRGHFEPSEIIQINDQILDTLHSSWDDIQPLPNLWEKQRNMISFHKKIKKLLLKNYSKNEVFCLKEPRISILLALYLDVFKVMKIEPQFIFIKRDKDEIAKSLKVRNKFSTEKSYLLTDKYLNNIDVHIRNHKHISIDFSDLIHHTRNTIHKIKNHIDAPLMDYESAREEIAKFIDPTLKHH